VRLREGLKIRALLLQTGRNSHDSLRSTNASVRSHQVLCVENRRGMGQTGSQFFERA